MVTATNYPSSSEELLELALQRRLTAKDLAALPDDGNRYEIIGGQLFVSPSPTYRHQFVSMKLGNALDAYLTSTNAGTVIAAPMDVYLSEHDVVQPDLLVVLNARTDIIQDRGIAGAPDLVVEIVSPSSATTDYLRKSKLYERNGVQEYWIVDPVAATMSVQRLTDGSFVLEAELDRNDTVRSSLLGDFDLDLSLIFLASQE